MEKHKNYIVVSGKRPDELTGRVNTKLKQGYVLIGGVSVDSVIGPRGDCSTILAQAMAKPIQEPAEA